MSQITLTKPLIEFNPEIKGLSDNESRVLKLLVEAAKLIVPIYEQQENHEFPGANLYPHDATKEEIEKAAENDPEILSPYTVVERKEGRLITSSYHKKYSDLLKPVANKLNEAANLTEDKSFSKYLTLQAKALLDGSYEDAMVHRLQMKPYILDISIGPNDYLDDTLFFKKYSYQAWVGVIDNDLTKRFTLYKDVILSARRKALGNSERVDNNDHVKSIVENVVVFSGLLARTKFTGLNIPFDINLVKKFGSEAILFKQAYELRVDEQIEPTFNTIFAKGFKDGFSRDDLIKGARGYVGLHEIAHSYLRYKNAVNLEDLQSFIEELAATALGFRIGGSLLLKDMVTTKDLESMIVVYLCRSMFLVKSQINQKQMVNYSVGGSIILNYMLENGAIKQDGGLSVPNFTKMFVCIHELSLILEQLLSSGDKKEAEQFIKKYGRLPDI